MLTLNSALETLGSALQSESTAIGITGENLSNQATPGYARQIVQPQADGYDPSRSQAGGVSIDTGTARSQFAEQAVWYSQGQAGQYQSFTQNASAVAQVMDLNDVSGSTGIQNSLSQLLASFSSLAASPNSTAAQNGVIQAAQAFAGDLNNASQTVEQSVTSAQSQAQNVVSQINQLVGQVQQYNQQIASGVTPGASAQAQVYTALETLSNLAPITSQQNSNGSLSIMMGGSTPLLEGNQQFNLQANLVAPAANAANPQGNPTLQILDAQGNDVTSSITGGQLGGVLNFVNNFAPTLVGNGSQQGALNQLAQGVANSANGVLGGTTPLFQYSSADPTTAAQSLEANTSFTSDTLQSDITANPNAAAQLSSIASGGTAATQINGQNFSDFLSTTASQAASTIDTQKSGLTLSSQLLAQAQANRTQTQGVSLETESVNLLQYQQAFEASSQVISVINSLITNTVDMMNVSPA